MVTLRATLPSDIPALQRLAIDTQVDTFGAYNTEANMKAYLDQAYNLDNLRQELDEPGSHNYLAFFDTSLAGFMRLRVTDEVAHFLGTSTIELQRLYVDKNFHGRGVGAAMMKEALRLARDKRYDWMWLGVWERNFKAQEFYAKWGFERFSEHIFQMGDDPQTDWLLRKRIN
jgi:ribosomal protein S18 acetylase RimI-like enzyme